MSGDVPDVTEAVTKKVGPLPGWAWIAIVAGAAWGIHLYKGRSVAPAPAALSTDASVAPVSGFPSGSGNAGGFAGAGSGSVSQQANGAPPVTTNAQWARSTADAMIAAGSDASTTSNALNAYISGGNLNSTQQAIVNTAISRYGSPPEGLLSVKGPGSFVSYLREDLTGAIFGITADGSRVWLDGNQYAALGHPQTTATVQNEFVRYEENGGKIYGVTGTGTRVWLSGDQYAALGHPDTLHFTGDNSSGTPQVTTGHKYVLVAGDTLASVATRFYGTANAADIATLSNANPGVDFVPGTTINVP